MNCRRHNVVIALPWVEARRAFQLAHDLASSLICDQDSTHGVLDCFFPREVCRLVFFSQPACRIKHLMELIDQSVTGAGALSNVLGMTLDYQLIAYACWVSTQAVDVRRSVR